MRTIHCANFNPHASHHWSRDFSDPIIYDTLCLGIKENKMTENKVRVTQTATVTVTGGELRLGALKTALENLNIPDDSRVKINTQHPVRPGESTVTTLTFIWGD